MDNFDIKALWTFETLESLKIDCASSVIEDVDNFLTSIGVPRNHSDILEHINFLHTIISFDTCLTMFLNKNKHRRITVQSVISSINSCTESLEKMSRGRGNIRLCFSDLLVFMEKTKYLLLSLISREERYIIHNGSFQHVCLQFCQMCGLISWPGRVPPRKLQFANTTLTSHPDIAFMTKAMSVLGNLRTICILDTIVDEKNFQVDWNQDVSSKIGQSNVLFQSKSKEPATTKETEVSFSSSNPANVTLLSTSNDNNIVVLDTDDPSTNDIIPHTKIKAKTENEEPLMIDLTKNECLNQDMPEPDNPIDVKDDRHFSLPLVASILTGNSALVVSRYAEKNVPHESETQTFGIDYTAVNDRDSNSEDNTRKANEETSPLTIQDKSIIPPQEDFHGFQQKSLDSFKRTKSPIQITKELGDSGFNIDHFRVEARGSCNSIPGKFEDNNKDQRQLENHDSLWHWSKERSNKAKEEHILNVASFKETEKPIAIGLETESDSNYNTESDKEQENIHIPVVRSSSTIPHIDSHSQTGKIELAEKNQNGNQKDQSSNTDCISVGQPEDEVGNVRKRNLDISGLNPSPSEHIVTELALSVTNSDSCLHARNDGSVSQEYDTSTKKKALLFDGSSVDMSFSFLKWLSDDNDRNTSFENVLRSHNVNQNSGSIVSALSAETQSMYNSLPEFVKTLLLEWQHSATTPYCFGLMQYKTYMMFVCLEISSAYIDSIAKSPTVTSIDRGTVYISKPYDILQLSDRHCLMHILFRMSMLS